MGLRRILLVLACLGATALLSGCFLKAEHEEGEALREGLDVRVGGIDYTVFITRQLNLELPDDRAYYGGPEARPGHYHLGVFLQACNRSDSDDELADGSYETAAHFEIVDTQENAYEQVEIDEENQLAYRATELAPGECMPATGSIAQQGPTGGAMLLFELPLVAGENRPLELEIAGDAPIAGQPNGALVELDL